MRLNQIRDFLAVVDHGSVRAAARALRASQPAMTKSLRLLEEQLGATLLARSARGVTPTPAGRAFLARARSIQAELRKAHEELAYLSGAGAGAVGVGVASVIGPVVLPEALARYLRRRPDGQVHVVEGVQESLFPLLRDETLDLAACLRLDSEPMTGLRWRPLVRVSLAIACRAGHPLRHARTLEALRDARWVMVRPRTAGNLLERAFALEGIGYPASVVRCHSLGVSLALVAASDMLTVVAPQVLARPIAHGLERIRLERPLAPLTAGLFTRADVPPSPAAAEFAAVLAGAMRHTLRPA